MLNLAKVNQQISGMAVEQQLVSDDMLKRLDTASVSPGVGTLAGVHAQIASQ